MEDQSWTSLEKANWPLLSFIMSFVGIHNVGNDNGKMSDGLTPSLPHVNNAFPSVQDKLNRKLLTAKRLLAVNLKHLKNE